MGATKGELDMIGMEAMLGLLTAIFLVMGCMTIFQFLEKTDETKFGPYLKVSFSFFTAGIALFILFAILCYN